MSDHELTRPDKIGPALATATGDDSWLQVESHLISGGKSNLTYVLTSPAGELILRRPPAGVLVPSAHDMGREVKVQHALRGTAVPVPRIVLSEDAELIGVPFYVMEKVDGHIIRDERPAGYADTDGQKRQIAFALVDVLADLHEVDPSSVGLADYGRPTGFVDRQVRRFTDQWGRSKTKDVDAVDALSSTLAATLPRSRRVSVVHGDLRLDNCVMSPTSPSEIAAVLDWELSSLGDPLTDLGLLLLYWREPGEPPSSLIPTLSREPGWPLRAELAERYAQRTSSSLDDIAFYEALAHFKFAVIVQGIAARVAADAMAGQDFGDLDGEVSYIAEAGLQLLAARRAS